MKHLTELEVNDVLYRQCPIAEYCQIKDITTDRHLHKVFDFGGFLVNTEAMPRMFKNANQIFEVK
jgi:hypothetical protein